MINDKNFSIVDKDFALVHYKLGDYQAQIKQDEQVIPSGGVLDPNKTFRIDFSMTVNSNLPDVELSPKNIKKIAQYESKKIVLNDNPAISTNLIILANKVSFSVESKFNLNIKPKIDTATSELNYSVMRGGEGASRLDVKIFDNMEICTYKFPPNTQTMSSQRLPKIQTPNTGRWPTETKQQQEERLTHDIMVYQQEISRHLELNRKKEELISQKDFEIERLTGMLWQQHAIIQEKNLAIQQRDRMNLELVGIIRSMQQDPYTHLLKPTPTPTTSQPMPPPSHAPLTSSISSSSSSDTGRTSRKRPRATAKRSSVTPKQPARSGDFVQQGQLQEVSTQQARPQTDGSHIEGTRRMSVGNFVNPTTPHQG